MLIQLPLFKKCGENVRFGHGCNFSHECIEIGNDVYIGPGACFLSGISTIKIGNKVMFGPRVTILGGDHPTDIVGAYMYDIQEKNQAMIRM
jgi:acetyltransferase-like isoleucine patch superfamily enzyme